MDGAFHDPAIIMILADWAESGFLDSLIEKGTLDEFVADMINTYR
jgi:hypothetical protein